MCAPNTLLNRSHALPPSPQHLRHPTRNISNYNSSIQHESYWNTLAPADFISYDSNGTAIVWKGWKLIQNKERPEGYLEYELFDHRKDPLNFVDVAAEHPDKVGELKGHLEAWRRWVDARRLPTDAEFTEAVSSEELERLRSLGYVQ